MLTIMPEAFCIFKGGAFQVGIQGYVFDEWRYL